MRTLSIALVLGCAASAVVAEEPKAKEASKRQWAVSICCSYLRGIGSDDVWTAARAVGLKRIEVNLDDKLACPYLFEKDGAPYRVDTPENRAVLREKLAKEGVSIGTFTLVTKLDADGSADEQMLGWAKRAAEASADMGRPVLMFPIMIVGPKGAKPSDEEWVARGKAFVRGLDRIAGETGVQIVIENLGYFWNRPEILEPVLKASKPDRVGLLLDIANMYWYGHPLDRLYELAAQFAPYVRYMHVKNVRYPEDQRGKQRTPGWEYGKYAEPVRTGDIDFARIVGIVAKAGYVGDLTIEDDSLPHFDAAGKKKAIADDVVLLQELIKRQGAGGDKK